MNNKFHIITLGCKLNIYESESISNILINKNYIYVDKIEDANYIIINSCTVTSKADSKCRNLIRKSKKLNPNGVIIVCGCLVESDLDQLKKLDEVDIIINNKNKDKIYDAIQLYQKNKKIKPIIYNTNNDGTFNFKNNNFINHSRAFVKIQDGCDNKCSYCKIPYVRGESRSRNIFDIIDEIDKIKNNNFNEIILTGINIASYNYDKFDFNCLLNILTNKYNDIRFRLSSIELQNITNEFITIFKKNNICPHLHIPLQSGSNKILNLMNRNYSIEYYEEIINKLREIRENFFLSTDLIIGFPGETEKEFLETVKFINRINFSYIHIFGFSPRKGTKAYNIKPKIPERIRDQRISYIQKISEEQNYLYRKSFLNKQLDVIIENKKNDFWNGKSDNYLDVIIKTEKELIPKKIYKVKITNVTKEYNFGEII